MDEMRLGSILLESKVISEADLEKCLEIQALTGNNRPMGQILVEQGLIDRATLERLLQLQQSRIGEKKMLAGIGSIEGNNDGFLGAAVRAGAREHDITEGRPRRARAGAEWRVMTSEQVRGPEVWDFVRTEMGSQVLEELADRHFVVRDLHRPGLCRGRVTALRHSDGVAVLVELRPEQTTAAKDLGIPQALTEVLVAARGLVLLVGERGIGRTELMAGVLQELAREADRYVVVLDDALDTDPPGGGALIARRRVGEHVSSYPSGLRTAVREDPDAILVGSLSDPDAFDLAVRAAEGGRLVVGWLDAGSVVGCLQRIVNFYQPYDVQRLRQSLASVLRAVCVRHLLSATDGSKMMPATELLLVDEAARDVIRGGDLANLALLMRTEGGKNGHSIDQAMFDLVAGGSIRLEDAYARAEEKAWLLERLQTPQGDGVVS